MSGGVDSSVTAYLLKERGYEVEAVSFLMWGAAGKETGSPPCSSRQAMEEASQAARFLGISHRTIDVRPAFFEKVVEPFVRAYLSGLTPNPCILCNRFIKFPSLIEEAGKSGAEYIATGHYARVERVTGDELKTAATHDALSEEALRISRRPLVKKAIDPKKDQSYVLYALGQEAFGRLILPLGHYRKDEVRKIARDIGLPAAERSESQEICFVEEKNYLAFIEKFSPVKTEPGPILHPSGKVIGIHKGIYRYTIGQRKGLGISSPEPLYVVDTDIQRNTVSVGPREAAKKREFLVGELTWAVSSPSKDLRVSVKVRSTMRGEPATIFAGFRDKGCGEESAGRRDETVRVVFDDPQWAPAPGQSAVFYEGDVVIGGGIIRKPA